MESARQQHITLNDLLLEAFGLSERRRDPVDMAVHKKFARTRESRREPQPHRADGAGKPLAPVPTCGGIIPSMWQASKSHPPSGGFQRFTLDLPMEDHCRFKALCALKRTSMLAEIQAVVAQAVASGQLVTESLYVPLGAELRAQLDKLCVAGQASPAEVVRRALEEAVRAVKRRKPGRPRRVCSAGVPVAVKGVAIEQGRNNKM